ncbi:endonuclease/exonuclease/phosphatase family protein [Kordia sp.]|uniref:endonuclease/exonuclease/phosphatase family protein n=1 Tax=Kordia sp. TaxID=1965332 RepID=UPI003D2C21D5
MNTTIAIIANIFAFVSYLPAFNISHWAFRVFDFIRIQLLAIQIIFFIILCFLYEEGNLLVLSSQLFILLTIIYQAIIIVPYLPIATLFKKTKKESNTITVISVNVLQSNTDYQQLIKLVNEVQPDILLTLETNKAWENALKEIEANFSYTYKVPKENRYGMHFYTKLKVENVDEHYFIEETRPAIEVHMFDRDGNDFVFLGIHPPPPSPTEKPTAKQKDAELMKVAKLVRELQSPSIVTGDFNNVCWSRSAKLFAKVSNLQDSRLGKGIHATFPVRPSIMRFPIDLLFSSKEIKVHNIKTLPDIGSDHLPFYCEFTIVKSSFSKANKLEPELKEMANEIIEEGHIAVVEEE